MQFRFVHGGYMARTKYMISVINESSSRNNHFIFQQRPPIASGVFSQNIFEQTHKAPFQDLKDGRLSWSIDYATDPLPKDGQSPQQHGPETSRINVETGKLLIESKSAKP